MAVVPMRRLALLGPAAAKRSALAELQELGCVHLIAARAPREEAPEPDEGRDAREALAFLHDCHTRRHQVPPDVPFDLQQVVRRCLEVKRELRAGEDRRDFLRQRLELLARWGNFSLPPGSDIAGYRLWFYEVPLYQMNLVRRSDLVWQEVNRSNRYAYVVVVDRHEPAFDAMPVPRTHMGSQSTEALRLELLQLELALEDLRAERVSLTRWLDRLRDNLNAADDRAALLRALHETWSEEDLFMAQGWAPAAVAGRLHEYARRAGLALVERPPAPTEAPPTLLDNRGSVSGGQAIVSFWQLPGYRAFDPSAIVALSFAAFAAMIMADAGYALVMAALLLLSWHRLGAMPDGRGLQLLGLLIIGAALLFGVLSGGYFGLRPPPDSFARRLWIIDLNDYEAMMRLAISIGALHLILGNVLAAWRYRGSHLAWGRAGWALAIAGGLGLWLGWQADPAGVPARVGAWSLALGLALVLLFGGEQRVRRPGDLPRRLLGGALALATVTRAFGDVLSYLRLFALGLASASLAVTFNELAGQLRDAGGAAGPYLAAGTLLVGHSLNFALILMSAVVHGLRLNLIEFFHWNVTEEGYPFRAFRRRSHVDEQLVD